MRPDFQLGRRDPRRAPRAAGSDHIHDFMVDVPERIVFGAGAEAHAAAALLAMGAQRVLIVRAGRREGAERIAAALGARCVGIFADARPHVPVEVAQAARRAAVDAGADWVLAYGGGSAIGVAKAVALEVDVAVAAIPTTYAGSERTDIWGITHGGAKITGRDPRVLPRLVVYDPALTASLPVDVSLQSLLNALAHSVEALYAEQATEAARDAAARSLAPLVAGMAAIAAEPADLDGRTAASYGAYLAGTALGGASMGLHHKLCHVLGGTFGTPHATTHAVLLPYVLAFNGPAAPVAVETLRGALHTDDPAAFLCDLARDLGVPTSLRGLPKGRGGTLTRADLERVAEIAAAGTYPNPRPVTREAVITLLTDAWHGRRPSLSTERLTREADGAHAQPASVSGPAEPLMEALVSLDALDYQTGYGNALASEAQPGALPALQNGPRHVPYGLYAEQINGTGFTEPRATNRRTWMYRLRPQIVDAPWESADAGRWVSRFDEGTVSPQVLRFKPTPAPDRPTTFVQGVTTFAGGGDPVAKQGVAVHLFSANADMVDEAFVDIDGDLLLAPHHGRLRIRTELGWLAVGPGEIAILPRGIRFQVHLPDGEARGFVAELFEGHLALPERGVIGANGLADERHFQAPVASYEDRAGSFTVIAKQGGAFWRQQAPWSCFDVVAWHGSYAPFKYDLRKFASFWSASRDHPDPSILTVLTAPAAGGGSALDVVAFVARWDATEGTFRPPYFHRNSAIEFNGVIASPSEGGSWPAGAFSYTPYLSPHGVSVSGYRSAVGGSDEEADRPTRGSDDSIWIQFESTYTLRVVPGVEGWANRDATYTEDFRDWPVGELGS